MILRSKAHARFRGFALAGLNLVLMTGPGQAIDENGNGLNDLWETLHGAQTLLAAEDTDGDGFTNFAESLAGTDPFDGASFLDLELKLELEGDLRGLLDWGGIAGKVYTPYRSFELNLDSWEAFAPRLGEGVAIRLSLPLGELGQQFYRLEVTDADSDGDGFTNWEEIQLGFDPHRTHTDREEVLDSDRIAKELKGANTVNVAVYDDLTVEGWPDPAVIVLRRSGGLQPFTVNIAIRGSGTFGVDYTMEPSGARVAFGLGIREVYLSVQAVADNEWGEATETVEVTLQPGDDYDIGLVDQGTISIVDDPGEGRPSAKEAARFLIQAAFGPDEDSASDADGIPENVEEVMTMGIEAWIDDQMTRPLGFHQPFVTWTEEQPDTAELYNDPKQNAWWGRAMGLPKLRPDAPDSENQLPDPLRQRVAYALSQIFVISDRMEDLATAPEGMTNFYDLLVRHAFGNYRTLLHEVSLHPCMGLYLSHLGNRKPDPLNNIFPDENFAREIMQLFSIGLWELNQDGTRKLDDSGEPIPSYDNDDITEFARVFTGIAFGGDNANFGLWPRDFTRPMGAWDAEHDLEPKTLLYGQTTPQRVASAGKTGTATHADIEAAVDNLFHHPNVGPFISRLLIQRLVTSNPSSAYVGRVAAVFNHPADRGNLGAVVKAILMDVEARDPGKLQDPAFGKAREPFLKCVNLARAFNAFTETGWYYLDAFVLDHAQEPHKSPSVFNFFLPNYSPPGELALAGLVAPEFQIITATTGVMAPNYFRQAIFGSFHRWGVADPARATRLNLDQEMRLNVPPEAINDPGADEQALAPEPLVRRLDLVLTGGTLTPGNYGIICQALNRIGPGSGWEWPKKRLSLAIYLILTSPEFAIQR